MSLEALIDSGVGTVRKGLPESSSIPEALKSPLVAREERYFCDFT